MSKEERRELRRQMESRPQGPVTCFFPASLVRTLKDAVAQDNLRRQRRSHRSHRLKQRITSRMQLLLQSLDCQAELAAVLSQPASLKGSHLSLIHI